MPNMPSLEIRMITTAIDRKIQNDKKIQYGKESMLSPFELHRYQSYLEQVNKKQKEIELTPSPFLI